MTVKLLSAKSGVGLLAIKSEAPVVPIRVFGTFESYGRHMKWPRPRRVQIKMGHPLWLKELREESKTASKERTKQIYQEAADQIMAAIEALTPNADCQKFRKLTQTQVVACFPFIPQARFNKQCLTKIKSSFI
jgi:1-acyl-sn-glycerol-3-phosphate acyltransferase